MSKPLDFSCISYRKSLRACGVAGLTISSKGLAAVLENVAVTKSVAFEHLCGTLDDRHGTGSHHMLSIISKD